MSLSRMGEHPRSQPEKQDENKRVGPFLIEDITIGTGTTGTVKLAQNICTGSKAAVKVVNKSIAKRKKEARKEIKYLQAIDGHENIIGLKYVEEDSKYIHIFTEYCEQGDLYNYVQTHGKLNEFAARKLFVQMLDAISFCHRKLRLCHHDVKLENFVLTSDFTVKLIDFGFAVEISYLPTFGKKPIEVYDGSPAYSALEVLQKRPHDESSDLFSLGACLYVMLCGCFPFCDPDKSTMGELIENLEKCQLNFPSSTILTPVAQDLLRKLLSKKAARISLEDIRAHAWMSGLQSNSVSTFVSF